MQVNRHKALNIAIIANKRINFFFSLSSNRLEHIIYENLYFISRSRVQTRFFSLIFYNILFTANLLHGQINNVFHDYFFFFSSVSLPWFSIGESV